jgi:uncharacterized membrane protein YgcG
MTGSFPPVTSRHLELASHWVSDRRLAVLLVFVLMVTSATVLASGPAVRCASLPRVSTQGVARVASPAAPESTPSTTILTTIQPPDDTIGHVSGRSSNVGRVGLPVYIPLATKHIYDQGALLSTSEEKTLEGDARVLTTYGVPVLVFVRRSTDTISESQTFADDLRKSRAVESKSGADDGLIMLLTLGLQSKFGGSFIFSIGEHALPDQGLSQSALDTIYREDIAPNLRQARIFDALNTSLRRMSYKAQFVPGDVLAVSGFQKSTASFLSFASPLLLVLFAGLTAVGRIVPDTMFRRIHLSRWIWNRSAIALGVSITVVLIPIGIYARSGLSIVCALIALLILTVFGFVKPNGVPTSGAARTIVVSPRRDFRLPRPGVTLSSPPKADSTNVRGRRS